MSGCIKGIGVDLFGKKKYQVAEKVEATAALVNKTIGENTTNNDTLLMILVNAFLVIVILAILLINAIARARNQKMVRDILKQQINASQERFKRLLEAIYHSPELTVKNVKIMEEER